MGLSDDFDSLLGDICSNRETDEEVDNMIEGHENIWTGERFRQGNWFWLELYQNIEGLVHVVRANFGTDQSSKGLHWPQKLFYDSRFSGIWIYFSQ